MIWSTTTGAPWSGLFSPKEITASVALAIGR
jgi:hypothetical protein